MPRVLVLHDQGKGLGRSATQGLLRAGKTYPATADKFDSHPGVHYWRIRAPRDGRTFLLEDGVEAVLPTNPHRLVINSLRDIDADCACEKWHMSGPTINSDLDAEIRNRIKEAFRQHARWHRDDEIHHVSQSPVPDHPGDAPDAGRRP